MEPRDKPRPSSAPARPRRRTTRRGLVPVVPEGDEEPTLITSAPVPRAEYGAPGTEPATSSRPTRRDFTATAMDLVTGAATARGGGPRGEFTLPSARGVATDVVAGSIDRDALGAPARRRRTTSMPVETVHLAAATKREITVIIKDQVLTLDRHDALALAQIIITAFD